MYEGMNPRWLTVVTEKGRPIAWFADAEEALAYAETLAGDIAVTIVYPS